MDLELRGKVAVVSAATKGIGLATALALAREGVRLALFSRDSQRLDGAARQIAEQTGVTPFTRTADLNDADSIIGFFDAVKAEVGSVDVLVANAVGPPPGRFEKFDDQDWIAAFEGALLSTVRMIRQVIPHMLQNGGGTVVAIQSASVKQPLKGLVLSNGVRPGVAGLMKSLANEYGAQGLRFNVVCPGRIATERLMLVESSHGQPLEERIADMTAEIPLRRLGTPEEVADAVVFLSSARAAYITGSVIVVDGGNVRGLY
jgi:3-oxoacyl-[acyl-carrier protein] reductase